MARKKREKELQPNIKVRLDRRTVITVRDRSKLEFWKEKYPGLEILEESYDKVEEVKEQPKPKTAKAAAKAKKPASKTASKPASKTKKA
jgi:hypothetical protein